MKKKMICLMISLTALTFSNITQASNTDEDKGTMTTPPTQPSKNPTFFDGLSGTFALASDYIFRGISQNQDLPAVQGGVTYTFPFNLYFNVWGSNVKYAGNTASVEIDTVVGYSNKIGENFNYDISYARYNYPRAPTVEYNELNTLFNWYFLQAGISYSANVYNTHESGTYLNGGINYTIPTKYVLGFNDVSVIALMGHYSLPTAGGPSYDDYNISLNKKFNDTYDFTLQWTDTNGKQKNPPYDSSHIVGILTANF